MQVKVRCGPKNGPDGDGPGRSSCLVLDADADGRRDVMPSYMRILDKYTYPLLIFTSIALMVLIK